MFLVCVLKVKTFNYWLLCITKHTFVYLSLIIRGYRKALEHSDLWILNPEDKSSAISPPFEKAWERELLRAKR